MTEIPAPTEATIFKNGGGSPASEASSGADENPPILKMAEREDWTMFRTVDGLQQKAGVPAARLRRLVLKELTDNALDAGSGRVRYGWLSEPDGVYVQDDGPGLDGTPEEIAALFSIRRPMRSSKLIRLPQRGALGNGLRVVAGAVLASEGSLVVTTRGRRIVLRPEADGSTAVVEVAPADFPRGTRIEIGLGPALPRDNFPFEWARQAAAMADDIGTTYKGRSSPFWYDTPQFHELILAYGSQPLRSLIAQFDGCTGAQAGEIVAAAGLDRATCESVNRKQAAALLTVARPRARPVNPERLGAVGREVYSGRSYAIARGRAYLGSAPQAVIPFVVEAWAYKTGDKGKLSLAMMVNRTPITGEIVLFRGDDKNLIISGCGLRHRFEGAPTKGAYDVAVNVTTPYCPITSDGKAPNLAPFVELITSVIAKTTKKAQRAAPKEKRVSQKDVVLGNLDDAIASASGDGEYRFNERQIFYQLREIVREETGQPLQIGNFKTILTDYEMVNGEIPGMYREPRGSIYHPHRGETITLGTLMVEGYERPAWTFNKLVYIEKEGFSEALKETQWAERHDCMLMSSKGFSSRAARDLVDKLAEHDEPVTIFCVHDADAYGTMIHQTFQEATRARRARKIKIVNLGLEPWEAVAAGLGVEDVEAGERRKPVATYVLQRDDGDYWEEWLQTHRVELNAMTTPEFIAWLDRKMTDYGLGKLIPPHEVLTADLDERVEDKVRDEVRERILREAGYEDQVAATIAAIEKPSGAALAEAVQRLFCEEPECKWRDAVEEEARRAVTTKRA
jgi:hypothetical protein